MDQMDMYVLYGILLVGSPAFGLEVLLLGLKGSLSSTFGEKMRLAGASTGIGSALVGASIVVTHLLSIGPLSPLMLCSLVLTLTFSLGWTISSVGRVDSDEELPEREDFSEEEVKGLLRDRGLSDLIDDEEESEGD